jgi:hypothetical protein
VIDVTEVEGNFLIFIKNSAYVLEFFFLLIFLFASYYSWWTWYSFAVVAKQSVSTMP